MSKPVGNQRKEVDWCNAYFDLRRWFIILALVSCFIILGFAYSWNQIVAASQADFNNYVACKESLCGVRNNWGGNMDLGIKNDFNLTDFCLGVMPSAFNVSK